MEQGQIILLLGLDHSKEQGRRKFTWKQGPVKKFQQETQVLIIDTCRKCPIAVLIGNTIGGTNRNQVYGVIPTVKILYVLDKSFVHTYTLSLAKNFGLLKIIYGTK